MALTDTKLKMLKPGGALQYGDRSSLAEARELLARARNTVSRGESPATAVHVREIIMLVYRHAISRGLKIENPADAIRPSAIATFELLD